MVATIILDISCSFYLHELPFEGKTDPCIKKMSTPNAWQENDFMKAQAKQFLRASTNPRLAETIKKTAEFDAKQKQNDDGLENARDYYFSKEKGDPNPVAKRLDDDRVLINPFGKGEPLKQP